LKATISTLIDRKFKQLRAELHGHTWGKLQFSAQTTRNVVGFALNFSQIRTNWY